MVRTSGFDVSETRESQKRYPVEMGEGENRRQVGSLSFQTVWLRSDAFKNFLMAISESDQLRMLARKEGSHLRAGLDATMQVLAVACGVAPEIFVNLLPAAVGTGPAGETALKVFDLLKPGPEVAALQDGRAHVSARGKQIEQRAALPDAGVDMKAMQVDSTDTERQRLEISAAKSILAGKLVRVQKMKLENLSRAVQRSKEELSLVPSRQTELKATMTEVTTYAFLSV